MSKLAICTSSMALSRTNPRPLLMLKVLMDNTQGHDGAAVARPVKGSPGHGGSVG